MATPGSWSFLAGLTIGYRKKGVLLVTKLYRVFIIGHPLSFFPLKLNAFLFWHKV
ncbi:hypothetical protein M070_1374 [Bacteroides fragilis str. A7 (UDC12-2)]|nr:hypothetical protein M070_1374 [Bacteroides fragilis str. A7 (UDC12-2)]